MRLTVLCAFQRWGYWIVWLSDGGAVGLSPLICPATCPTSPDTPQVAPGAFDGNQQIQQTMNSISDYNAGQSAAINNQLGPSFSPQAIQPAVVGQIGSYNGLNSPLINAGYDGQGGYSSGVSPTTAGINPANPFPSGIDGGTSPLFQNNTPTAPGGGNTPIWPGGNQTPTIFNFQTPIFDFGTSGLIS